MSAAATSGAYWKRVAPPNGMVYERPRTAATMALVGVLIGWRYLSRSVPVLSRGDAQTRA